MLTRTPLPSRGSRVHHCRFRSSVRNSAGARRWRSLQPTRSGPARAGLLAIELQVVGLELVLLLLLVFLLARERNLAAGLVGDAEVLDQFVALVFIERGLVGDQHPVGALE